MRFVMPFLCGALVLTPSIVSDVSATFVETMIFRVSYFCTARSCASGGNSPCSG